jgi:general secretion pathway protein K
MRREQGWALVSVLWALSVLAMLVAASEALSYSAARQERYAFAGAESDALLDAAIARTVLGLTDARPEKRWPADGTPRTINFAGSTMRVSVQDESGRIDLNAADGSLFTRLLQSADVEKGTAGVLADRIVDWRSRGDHIRTANDTSDDYARAGLSYPPRHGAFQSVDELRLVLGMTPALFKRIRPALTVYSHHPAIDTDVAPREALQAYYLDQPDLVDDLMSARGKQDNDGDAPSEATMMVGRAFDIIVSASNNRQSIRREAVVMLTGSKSRPWLTLAWR